MTGIKRVGYIYEKIYDIENIKRAIKKASEKKRARRDVKRILENIDLYAEKLQKILIEESFIPAPPVQCKIIDGPSRKERIITIPKFFPDHCLHWALMLQLEPIIMKSMDHYCCGSVPKRGAHYAKRYIERWITKDRKHTKYICKMDITKCYPSIRPNIVIEAFNKKIKDARVIRLIRKIVEFIQGLPLGFYTSQWFCNFILQPLDHFIRQVLKVKYCVRYVDDIVLFGSNKKKLHLARATIEDYLLRMGLVMKGNWQVFRTDDRGLDFLGFRFFRKKTTLRRRNMLKISRKAKRISKREKVTYKMASGMLSYLGWVKHSNSYGFYDKWVKPYIDIKKLKDVIRNESKLKRQTAK